MSIPACSHRGRAFHHVEKCFCRHPGNVIDGVTALVTFSQCLQCQSGSLVTLQLPQSSQIVKAGAGAGTELKQLLSLLGISATPDCPCNARAAEMDARGPDWCSENLPTIVGWLQEAAAVRGLPFVFAAARQVVRIAISRARRKQKGRKDGTRVHAEK